jgi:hypothetical protein
MLTRLSDLPVLAWYEEQLGFLLLERVWALGVNLEPCAGRARATTDGSEPVDRNLQRTAA